MAKKHFLFFDKQGNAVGVAEETSVVLPVEGKIGAETTQTIIATAGGTSDYREEIDASVYKDINDPSKKIGLKDFKVKNKK